MARPFTHDTWAALNYVEDLGDGDGQTMPAAVEAQTWLTYDDARRLTAYRILAAKLDNVSKYFLPAFMWKHEGAPHHLSEQDRIRYYLASLEGRSAAEKWREYGDPSLLVESAVSLLLGDSQDLVLPVLAERLKELSDEQGNQSAGVDDTAAGGTADDQAPGDGATPDPNEAGDPGDPEDVVRLRIFDSWLQQWADDERLGLRLVEGETNAVGLGDGVYTLGWSDRLGRPRLRVYDPGFYFPDLATMGPDDEFPRVVHVAWEQDYWTDPASPTGTRDSGGHMILHKITWRLVDCTPANQKRWPVVPDKAYQVAYSDKPVDRVLIQSVSEWDRSALKGGDTIYNLDEASDSRADVIQPNKALGVDFLSVVHDPNDASGARHFGKSLLLTVAQALDDTAATDTDLQVNSELVGSSPMVTTGAGAFQPGAGPGEVMNMPAGADAKFLDTSKVLTGLTGYARWLRSVTSINSRLSETILGRISPADVPSGYAFDLGFAPTRALVRKMRLVRDEKYPLILKFAMRLAQVNGQGDTKLPSGETPRAEIALGGYLPSDKAGAMTRVKDGLTAHAISRLTGVQVLIEAGFPIEDAEAEVDRIRAEATADMVQLVDALGQDGEDLVRRMLGIDVLPRIPVVPVPPGDQGAGGAGGAGTGQ